MSYSFRDKPRTRLSDRLRGKSSDELLQEMRQEFDKDRKTFFDSNPNWGFTPAGSAFPRRTIFDDDDENSVKSSRGRTDLRAHLDDLARRHPEFAEHLRSPPGWVSDFHPGPSSGGAEYSGSSSGGGHSREGGGSYYQETPGEGPPAYQCNNSSGQQSSPGNQQGTKGFSGNNLAQGLRNTDPEIGLKGQAAAKEDRNQRSMSAPPDGRSSSHPDKPHRFVSKIEINPVNPATGETAAPTNSAESGSGKPPMAPPKPQQQPASTAQPQQSKQTVRHIPIFVEGRDEPVLPKNIDHDFSMPSSNTSMPRQQQFHPQQHSFSNCSNTSQPPPAPAPPPPQQQQQPHSAQRKQTQPQPPQESKANDHVQQSQSPPTTEKKQKVNNDPIFQVQQIQHDVEQLRGCVSEFRGSSRADKDYMYLDEMLTRNLIKLDNIETDGKENVRLARREAIKSIQQCISLLESKVPQTPSVADPMDVDETTQAESAAADGQQGANKMESEEQQKNEAAAEAELKANSNSSTEIKC